MEIKEIIKQVFHNPQVSHPPITYKITDKGVGDKGEDYTSEYIDIKDFESFLVRLEHQLNFRLKK